MEKEENYGLWLMAITIVIQALEDLTRDCPTGPEGQACRRRKASAYQFFNGPDWQPGVEDPTASSFHMWLQVLGLDPNNKPSPEEMATRSDLQRVYAIRRNWQRRAKPETPEDWDEGEFEYPLMEFDPLTWVEEEDASL